MIKRLTNTDFLKQLSKFLLVGGLATCLDATIYYFLSEYLSNTGRYSDLEAVSFAKKVASGFAVIWVFFANKFFTFSVKEETGAQTYKFIILYSITFLVNTSTHDLLYHLTQLKSISFVIATGVTAVINFTCLKLWVFKKKKVMIEV